MQKVPEDLFSAGARDFLESASGGPVSEGNLAAGGLLQIAWDPFPFSLPGWLPPACGGEATESAGRQTCCFKTWPS